MRHEIALALIEHALLMVATGPELPVSVPEPAEVFVPPADGRYIDVGVFPNVHKWEGMTHGKMEQGLLGITVVWPKNQGIITPNAVAEQVAAHFSKGLVLRNGSTMIKINREPVIAEPLIEADKVSVPVNISWEAARS